MKLKQALMVLAMLVASGNVLAQDNKTPPVAKEVKKQLNDSVRTQPVSSNKAVIRESSSPDSPGFLGVPLKAPDRL